MRIRTPIPVGLIAFLAAPTFACVFFAVWLVREHGVGFAALFACAVAGAMGWGLAKLATVTSMTVSPEGISFGKKRIRWDDLTGLGARVVEIPGMRTTWFYAYANDGTEHVFTDRWVGDVGRVAAMVQQATFEPVGALDREAALANGPRPSPNDALPMDAEQLERFVATVERVYDKGGTPIRVNPRRLQARTPTGTLELYSLGRKCAQADPEGWRTIVRAHKKALDAAFEESRRLSSERPALADVRARLRLRLAATPDALARSVGGGLFETVVYDCEVAETSVPAALLDAWEVTRKDLRKLAAKNFRARAAVEHVERGGVHLLVGADATAALFFLEKFFEVDEELGALVGVAATDCVVVEPIADFASMFALLDGKLPGLVRHLSSNAERPLSTDLCWWRDGKLEPIQTGLNDKGGLVWVVPPELSTRLAAPLRRE